MKHSTRLKKYENCILTLIVMAVNVLLMGIQFDFYYDLNDDTMMHDIMSGIYSGIPDGHNMQTLYPLGALIALCYKVCRNVPWYGLFLCLCQFGCFYLIGVRLCSLQDDMPQSDNRRIFGCKIVHLLLLSLFQWGIWLPHLVNVQYTITCAMMSAAAIFLFLTTVDGLDTQQFVVKNIPSALLVIVAYMLRSEMLLLTLPFICLAGFYRLTEEKKILTRENLFRYGAVLGTILTGMLLVSVVDYAAYSSAEWKDFRDYFNARTTVYDFYPELITEDAYGESLTQIGVTSSQQELLRNYNFGLDDEIDTELLVKVANYATNTLGASKDWMAIARDKFSVYIYRMTHSQDAPYHVMVFWAYAAVFVMGGLIRRYAFLWQLILLAFVRSAIWMFIMMRGRDPERITHSLYLVEFVLLAAMLTRGFCVLYSQKKSGIVFSGMKYGLTALFILIAVGDMAGSIINVRDNQEARVQVNTDWYAIDAYCREHEGNFYFEDVYSTVLFSRRMFDKTDNSYANYDIMGGWICKSPLYCEKIGHYDINSMQDALLKWDNVYLIMSDQEISDRGIDWIVDYYKAQNIAAKVEQADKINVGYGYSVLQIEEQ